MRPQFIYYSLRTIISIVCAAIAVSSCSNYKDNGVTDIAPTPIPKFTPTSWIASPVAKTPTNLVASLTPTLANSNAQRISLVSKYDPNFIIVNLTDLQSLVDHNNKNAFYDFDSASMADASDADVYLSVGCGSYCFNDLIEINGAKAVRMKTSPPGLKGCQDALSPSNYYNGLETGVGWYSCMLTNGGNIVEILVVSNESDGYEGTVVFEFRVWKIE